MDLARPPPFHTITMLNRTRHLHTRRPKGAIAPKAFEPAALYTTVVSAAPITGPAVPVLATMHRTPIPLGTTLPQHRMQLSSAQKPSIVAAAVVLVSSVHHQALPIVGCRLWTSLAPDPPIDPLHHPATMGGDLPPLMRSRQPCQQGQVRVSRCTRLPALTPGRLRSHLLPACQQQRRVTCPVPRLRQHLHTMLPVCPQTRHDSRTARCRAMLLSLRKRLLEAPGHPLRLPCLHDPI